MTTPPDPQHDRPEPLRERSLSQINKLAIRIVPYTPPRLASVAGSSAEDGAPSPASSHYGHGHGHGHGRALCSPSSAAGGQDDERYALAGGWGAGVSATKLSPVGIPAGDNVGPGARTASVPLCPSEISDITDTNPDESVTPRPTSREHPGHDVQDGPASPTTDVSRPLSRRRISVALHSNKTFTLVGSGAASPGSLRSPPLSLSCSASSSHADRPSTGAWSTEDRPSSSLTVATFTSAAYPPFTPSPGASSLHLPVPDDSKAAVAWSHRMVGGLRRVPKSSLHAEPTTLAPLPEFLVYRDCEGEDDDDAASASKESPPPAHELVPKASFASAQTTSTTSETTNYRVYGHSSPVHLSSESLIAPSPGDANYEILDRSSPALPDVLSSPPGTSDSEQNFVVHGNPSAATSQVSVIRNPRPTCSQESLRVPALRTLKARSSSETFGYYRQRSRESLRQRSRESLRARTGELRSIKSFSSLISQEGRQTLFAAPALANLPTLVSRSSRDGRAGVSAARSRLWVGQHQLQQPAAQQRLTQASWSASDAAAEPSSAGSLLAQHPVAPQQSVPMIQAHPHQWSSQLSTVISESEGEGGSEPPLSRSVSALSGVAGGDNHWHRRRSSVGWASSLHSRQLPSLSSSLSGQVEEAASSSSPEPPQQTYERGGLAGTAGLRTVRDQDEHGDGLGDLRKLSPRPSRSGLSGFFSSSSSSSSNSSSNRNLHSSGSSKANSLTWGSIPAWARSEAPRPSRDAVAGPR